MEYVKIVTVESAIEKYNDFMQTMTSPFQRNKSDTFSWNHIQFAKQFPDIYKLLFLSEQKQECISQVDMVGARAYIISAIKDDEKVCDEVATKLFLNMWAFTHGIATLIVMKTVELADEQINQMLADVTGGLLKEYDTASKGGL